MRCPTLSELPPPPPGKTGWPWTAEGLQMPDVMPDGRPWPRISIVTPSFNQGPFIEETIRSILLQGYPDIEYIIMDGGSTDETVSIIRRYERWIAYWVSEPDRGQSHAVNKGWKIATGDFISWLNSDDYLMPEWARDSVLALAEDSESELVCGDNLTVDSQSQPSPFGVIKGADPRLESLVLYWSLMILQPGFLMRRCVLNQCGFLDEDMHYNMDFDYWVRILMRGIRVKYIPKVLATFRANPASKSSNLHRVAYSDHIRIAEKFAKEAPVSLQNIARRARRRAYWNAACGALWHGDMELARRYALRYLVGAGLSALPKVFCLCILSFLNNLGKRIFQLYQVARNYGKTTGTPHGTTDPDSRPSKKTIESATD